MNPIPPVTATVREHMTATRRSAASRTALALTPIDMAFLEPALSMFMLLVMSSRAAMQGATPAMTGHMSSQLLRARVPMPHSYASWTFSGSARSIIMFVAAVNTYMIATPASIIIVGVICFRRETASIAAVGIMAKIIAFAAIDV